MEAQGAPHGHRAVAGLGRDRRGPGVRAGRGVAYYTLLALFPAIGVFVSLYGLVADVSSVQQNIEDLALILPAGSLELIAGQMQRIASQPPKSLGLAFFAGLAISRVERQCRGQGDVRRAERGL